MVKNVFKMRVLEKEIAMLIYLFHRWKNANWDSIKINLTIDFFPVHFKLY